MEYGRAFNRDIKPKRITVTVSPKEADLIRRVRETPYGEVSAKIKDGILVLFTITRTDYPSEDEGMALGENIVDD